MPTLSCPSEFSAYKWEVAVWLVCYCRVSWIQSIVVVVAKENMDLMMDIIQRFQHRKVRVVPGGSTRHRSIRNGVLALGEGEGEEKGEQTLPAGRPKVAIIHDAVRPFVEEDFLYKIAVAAKEHGVSLVKALIYFNKNFLRVTSAALSEQHFCLLSVPLLILVYLVKWEQLITQWAET